MGWLDLCGQECRERRFVDIPCTGRNNMVAIGSTVKERALTLRVRFGAYPESAQRRPEKGVAYELAVIDRHNDSLAARPASCSLGRMLEGMKSMAASPCGFWTSPITSDLVVADSIRVEQVSLDGDAIYWTETRLQKQGRAFVYRIGADGEPERGTPDDANAFSIRTRVHEYGGGSFAVSDSAIYFSNNIDQRLYRQDAGRPPSPITPAPAGTAVDAFRYADGVIDRRRGRMVCVREDHTGAGEAITTLVAVDLSGATATQVLISGNDFYSRPR
jgi:hypothetical protein